MDSTVARKIWSRTYNILTWSFITITIACIIIGLGLNFPSSGLDPSWQFSANQAVAQDLTFGKDFIFTFGPYSSLYTGLYHPATDGLMILSGLILTIGLSVSLILLNSRRNNFILILLCSFLAAYKSTDALLFFYPLSIALLINKLFPLDIKDTGKNKKTIQNKGIIILLFSILGLLPLIKVSTALICATTIITSAAYFFLTRKYATAIFITIAPILMMLTLWMLAGQEPSSLISFLTNSSPIVSGYTEAMSSYGNNSEIVIFIITCLWGLIILLSMEKNHKKNIFIALNFAIYLFLSFKAGFTRHDAHAMIAGCAIVMAGACLTMLYNRPKAWVWLLGCMATWFYIASNYDSITPEIFAQKFEQRYTNSWRGLNSRINNATEIKNDYQSSIARINKELQIPQLSGTSDIYSYGQSYLLASGNTWHPRPVIQSYSVYTAGLAKINSEYLAKSGADNIFFNVETIDNRFPSLDDGASWPVLLNNYKVLAYEHNILQLKRRDSSDTRPLIRKNFDIIKANIGDNVDIPRSSTNVFAEIDLQPNFFGKLRGLFFKQSLVNIIVKTRSGQEITYRYIPSMGKSDFLISPLIVSSADFLIFATGEKKLMLSNEILSFRLEGPKGFLSGWKSNFDVNLGSYDLPSSGQGLIKYNTPAAPSVSTLIQTAATCNGVVDSLNRIVPPLQLFPRAD